MMFTPEMNALKVYVDLNYLRVLMFAQDMIHYFVCRSLNLAELW